MNAFRFYCKKNGESFVIRIHILSNKIKSNRKNLNSVKKALLKRKPVDYYQERKYF